MKTRIQTGKTFPLLLMAASIGVMLTAALVAGFAPVSVAAEAGVVALPTATADEPISNPLEPIVGYSTRNDVSPPLRSIQPITPSPDGEGREIPRLFLPRRDGRGQDRRNGLQAPPLQDWPAAPNMPLPIQSFEGISNVNNVQPPDAQGDVGPNHYVQWVNQSFAIWDKQGNRLYGPADGNTLWTGFGGPCETENDGDPITLYDPLAGRWFMSQFAIPNSSAIGPFYQCIAVSQTGDPTGDWYLYEFMIPVDKMNDYPKFGVWPDGYYMSVNQFDHDVWAGAGVAVFERDNILQGKMARMIYFDVGAVDIGYGGMLPADLDGLWSPPDGSPNYFAEWDDSTQLGDDEDTLRLWEFRVDWDTPSNSTFGLADYGPNLLLSTADVDPNMCNFNFSCIPQPNTTNRLDAISDRLMYRLQYRNFGDYETLLTNHTVDVGGDDHAGIHWIELRRLQGGDWDVHQEGLYAPDDDHRWMGSIAMDHVGNVALGYSVSSGSTFPSIRYTGRLADDPLGVMAQGEAELVAGTGSQTYFGNRWGDYSMMAVDPVDDCTFWYTQEYYQTSGSNWQTRIGSFKFPDCTTGPRGILEGIVYGQGGAPETDPIAGAVVQAGVGSTLILQTTTDGDGRYTMWLHPGVYTATAAAYGYHSNSITGVNVISGATMALNIALAPAATHVVSGFVTDFATGWPLYARITVRGDLVDPVAPGDDFWSDPITGYYSATLAGGITYTFDVEAWTSGYLSASHDVGPLAGNRVKDWTLDADPIACNGPGYVTIGTGCNPLDGGLVVGQVHDANTGGLLPGAGVTVTVAEGDTVTALSTPDDPAVEDALYILFSPVGSHTLSAAMDQYGPDEATVTVVQGDVVQQDFYLPAGRLSYEPDGYDVTLQIGASAVELVTLSNIGGVSLEFELVEKGEQAAFDVVSISQASSAIVPWLSEDPITGTIPSGSAADVAIAFDAGVPEITQPGQYQAQLILDNDTPYPAPSIPVTMTVSPLPGWGKLEGVVASLGYCDVNPFPLKGVSVIVTGSSGMTWTLMTGDGGEYHLWLEETHSPLTVLVSHPDYTSTVMSGVTVADQAITRRDVDWRWLRPCVSVDPVGMSVALDADDAVTKKLTISNDGATATVFELYEEAGATVFASSDSADYTADVVPWLSEIPVAGELGVGGDYAVDVTFATSPIMPHGVYPAVLDVRTGDVVNPSIHVPMTLTVSGPWEKRVRVNGVLVAELPVTIVPGDVVQIVDQVEITHTDLLTFTLVEDWTEPLSLVGYTVVALPGGTVMFPGGTGELAGSKVITGNGVLTWTVVGLPGDWSYAITKTFDVGGGDWHYGSVTENLWIEGAGVLPSERVVRFVGTAFDVYLPIVVRGF